MSEKIFTLKELATEHPYYCSESNYFSRKPEQACDTASEFLNNYEDTDIDLNLAFRFDVKELTDDLDRPTGHYSAEVFLMLQRKGIFKPVIIYSINEEEAPRFCAYLWKHYRRLQEIWAPLAAATKGDDE